MIGRLRSPAIALLSLAVILGAASSAADATPARTSSLAWIRMPEAEACIDVRTLAQAVELRLGRVAFVAPTRGDVAIEARIERLHSPDAWRATITVFDATGARTGLRELRTDRADCHAIDDELELVIALLIDPSAALAPAVVPTPPIPIAPPIPRAPPPPIAPPVLLAPPIAAPPPIALTRPVAPVIAAICPPLPPPPASSWRASAELGPIAGLGLLPSSVGVGVQIRAHVAPPRGPSFELGGAFWLDSLVRTTHAEPAFSLAYASLSVCPLDADVGRSALSACVGAELGSLRVSAAALPSEFHQEKLVFSLAAEARLRRRFLGPLLASFGLGLAVPTVRDQFYFTDPAGARHDVFRAAPIAALFDAGLGVELP